MPYKAYGSLETPEGTITHGHVEADLLIVGSGLAGLWAAYYARKSGVKDVAVVDKCSIGESSQSRMSAGATLYMTGEKDFESWKQVFADQQKGLSRSDLVNPMLKESSDILKEEKSWGLWYENMPWGSPELPVGGAETLKMHVLPRYRNMAGGAALINAVKDKAVDMGVDFYSKTMISELIKNDGKITGAKGISRTGGEEIIFNCNAVVLAAGDCSFGNTGCIGQATGDAYALAFNVGATLSNMEFWGSNTGSPEYAFESISDTAAAFGCYFTNHKGRKFMNKYSEKGDKAEPYIIAQSISKEMSLKKQNESGNIHFHMNKTVWKLGYNLVLKRKMNGALTEMFSVLKEQNINPFNKAMSWGPLMRTIRGGIVTDTMGASPIPGLFAAGTAQALDPIGLNGISTLRAMWSGKRAGQGAAEYIQNGLWKINGKKDNPPVFPDEEKQPEDDVRYSPGSVQEAVEKMQSLLFHDTVSLRKDESSLKTALSEVERLSASVKNIKTDNAHEKVHLKELENMILTARLYLTASIERKESRGEHLRTDFPRTDNRNWCRWICLDKDRDKIRVKISQLKEMSRD